MADTNEVVNDISVSVQINSPGGIVYDNITLSLTKFTQDFLTNMPVSNQYVIMPRSDSSLENAGESHVIKEYTTMATETNTLVLETFLYPFISEDERTYKWIWNLRLKNEVSAEIVFSHN